MRLARLARLPVRGRQFVPRRERFNSTSMELPGFAGYADVGPGFRELPQCRDVYSYRCLLRGRVLAAFDLRSIYPDGSFATTDAQTAADVSNPFSFRRYGDQRFDYRHVGFGFFGSREFVLCHCL